MFQLIYMNFKVCRNWVSDHGLYIYSPCILDSASLHPRVLLEYGLLSTMVQELAV